MAPQDTLELVELRQVTVRSAPQAAAQMLRSAIIGGRLKPGERLLEQKLATRMGIGQPTLREALKQLEYEGFVRKVPQRGSYVTKLGKEDYRKVLEVRIVLEGLAIELATRNLNPKAESEIVTSVEEMGRATAESDLAKFHKADVAFHRKIWELADNQYLTKALESIVFPVFAFALLELGPEVTKQRQAAVRQHEEILAGLRSRDPVKARQTFITHTVRYWKELYHFDLKQGELASSSSIQEGLAV
jgi:DNA-binding GntR family transcriptional regulator